ncbi:uncharacterized protein LOC121759192 isoform X1 [Salvia splendens]|uniref:uncharacterized protein LOC121759192 isoform X1 n=2 Tax=Salvia splendens TaxID=180675 RepID=UPI001C2655E7|nr:uncharacterized protein LOC121759192 isoform X1 [Salvia splendens]
MYLFLPSLFYVIIQFFAPPIQFNYNFSSMASPNLSATAASSSASSAASSSVGSGSRQITDIRAPLWDHVTILEKPKPGGGNILWRCNYCPFSKSTSYTRVEAHLLQKLRQGIKTCPNVSFEMLSDMRREVEKCKELLERSKACTVSLPVAPSDNSKRTKRGPVSQLEKSWALQDRKHLDALIVRAMFSGGISFNFLRNPYFREAFAFACSRNLPSYTIPGYNRARESLLKQERRHIETLLLTSPLMNLSCRLYHLDWVMPRMKVWSWRRRGMRKKLDVDGLMLVCYYLLIIS